MFWNKADLPIKEWKITREEINEFAQANKLAYFETSAETKMGIMEGISYMANEIYERKVNKIKEDTKIEIKDTKKLKKIWLC